MDITAGGATPYDDNRGPLPLPIFKVCGSGKQLRLAIPFARIQVMTALAPNVETFHTN